MLNLPKMDPSCHFPRLGDFGRLITFFVDTPDVENEMTPPLPGYLPRLLTLAEFFHWTRTPRDRALPIVALV